MTDSDVRNQLTHLMVFALTLWGEGRGDRVQGNSSVEERIAIGCTVRNRLPRYKEFRAMEPTYRALCLAPNQFSCWNPLGGSENYQAVMTLARRIVDGFPTEDLIFSETIYLADGIMSGVILDRTKGSTMYWAPKAMIPANKVPVWAVGREALNIGDQKFVRA